MSTTRSQAATTTDRIISAEDGASLNLGALAPAPSDSPPSAARIIGATAPASSYGPHTSTNNTTPKSAHSGRSLDLKIAAAKAKHARRLAEVEAERQRAIAEIDFQAELASIKASSTSSRRSTAEDRSKAASIRQCVDGVEQAASLAHEIVTIHKAAGFEMRSWVSNNAEALSLIPKDLHAAYIVETTKDEEEWQASSSSSEDERKHKARAHAPEGWHAADSTGPDQDSECDEPLFEIHHEEPDLEFNKSDHEFSPESDLKNGEPPGPLKRARTLQEEKDDGFIKRCGSEEQPEWILLCDQCDQGYPASCLKSMPFLLLFLVPESDWFCPPCDHNMLIASLQGEFIKYDELVIEVEAERAREKEEEVKTKSEDKKEGSRNKRSPSESSGSSSWSPGGVYRQRAQRQLPVSYRAQEYHRLISSAIKEEYVKPTTSAGNQGRGKDISTIIKAAKEEKLKAERETIEQGNPIEIKRLRKKTRWKPPQTQTFDDSDLTTRAQWRKSQRLADHFWQRFVKEYLPTLVPRRGSCTESRALKVGDVVCIADGTLPRRFWPRGRIVETYPGKDGIVRGVDVASKGGVLRRPVRKLALVFAAP